MSFHVQMWDLILTDGENASDIVNLMLESRCLCRTVFYGQYKCMGPGAGFGGRVSWSRELTPQEARPFISLGFINGYEWLPKL